MFTVDQIVDDYYPSLSGRKSCNALIKPLLRRILYENAFIRFAEQYPHLKGIEFVEQVLDYFSFGYAVSGRDCENIPSNGRVVIIANHPIGSLDGLALLKMVHEIRSDVRIVANDLLMAIPPLKPCLLPVRVFSGRNTKRHFLPIIEALQNEEAIIIFPAGEVSRLKVSGIKDGRWHTSFLKIAEKTRAPILPIHIWGRNSAAFYLTASVIKPLSTLMLVREMFRQKKKQVRLTIGSIISYESYHAIPLNRKATGKLFKKHTYQIGRGKKPLIKTDMAIARPERRAELKRSILKGERLGKTPDGKIICLFTSSESSPVIREIGNLRERAFRAVGEGTGQRRDLDPFDFYYQHLVLWDEDDLEIAGAYRFADAGRVVKEKHVSGLYTGDLFKLDIEKCYFLENGLELGRSFVQQRYWGKRSLDYLWYGIGAYLAKNPHYRYLFGPVSISNAMPQTAKELLIYFYKLYFSGPEDITPSRNPFRFSQPLSFLAKEFSGINYRADLMRLKSLLSNLGTTIPPLYKQYTELCEPGGVVILDFNIDPAFNNCVDGLVIVDLHRLKLPKKKRYIDDRFLL